MARISSKGKCLLCNGTFAKAGMSRHLDACLKRRAAAQPPPEKPTYTKARYFHLLVDGRWQPAYWLHLDVRASVKLGDLDRFLRHIWLECCGHLSAFRIGETSYSVSPMRDLDEKGVSVALGKVLRPKMEFTYEYDFGTTTELRLKVISERDGELRENAVELLARNDPPDIPCGQCGKPATQICSSCSWNQEGWLCSECAQVHPCGEDMLLPVVNSPRTGQCAYTGPADASSGEHEDDWFDDDTGDEKEGS